MKNGPDHQCLGQKLVAIPAHPRIARLLLAAAEIGALEIGCALAAIVSERDFVTIDYATHPRNRGPSVQGNSDLLLRLDQLRHAEKSRNFAAISIRDAGIDPDRPFDRLRLGSANELIRQTSRLQTPIAANPPKMTCSKRSCMPIPTASFAAAIVTALPGSWSAAPVSASRPNRRSFKPPSISQSTRATIPAEPPAKRWCESPARLIRNGSASFFPKRFGAIGRLNTTLSAIVWSRGRRCSITTWRFAKILMVQSTRNWQPKH